MRPNQVTVGWLTRAVSAYGVPDAAIAAAADLDPAEMMQAGYCVSATQYHRLFEWAAEATGDGCLGIRIAEGLGRADLGLLGYLVENSPYIGAWLRNFARYHDLFGRDCVYRAVEGDGFLRLEYEPYPHSGVEPRQDVMLAIAGIVGRLRRYIGPRWAPASCSLTIARPPAECARALRDAIGTSPRYGRRINAFVVAAEDLKRPVPGADAALFSILRQQAEQMLLALDSDHDVVHRLKILIAANVADRSFGARVAAASLDMSVRTLHRELARAGANFREVREEVVHDLARRLLRDGRNRITDIAHKLGYSETSAFTRAFARMAKQSPSDYRKVLTTS